MNDGHDILRDADVLVVGEQIAGVGPGRAESHGKRQSRLARR